MISVNTQNINALVTPNFENTHTINKINGIAIIEAINAVLNRGKSEFLQTTFIIPAIRGQIIKNAKVVVVSRNPFYI